jgi:hypothetical protein
MVMRKRTSTDSSGQKQEKGPKNPAGVSHTAENYGHPNADNLMRPDVGT